MSNKEEVQRRIKQAQRELDLAQEELQCLDSSLATEAREAFRKMCIMSDNYTIDNINDTTVRCTVKKSFYITNSYFPENVSVIYRVLDDGRLSIKIHRRT